MQLLAKFTKFRVIHIIFTVAVMGQPYCLESMPFFILPVTFPVKEQDKIKKTKQRLVDIFLVDNFFILITCLLNNVLIL